jgi:hypothetical protein
MESAEGGAVDHSRPRLFVRYPSGDLMTSETAAVWFTAVVVNDR